MRAGDAGGGGGSAWTRRRAPLRRAAAGRGRGRPRSRATWPPRASASRRPTARRSSSEVTSDRSTAPRRSPSTARSRRRARSTRAGALRMLELSREIAAREVGCAATCTSRPPTSPVVHGACFQETDLDLGQGFRNTYEHSKFDGEVAIGEAAGEPAARDRATEHHRRRQPQRLDLCVQRHLLADAGVLARADGRDRDRPRRRRPTSCRSTTSATACSRCSITTRRAAPSRSWPAQSAPTNAELIELASRQFGREPPRIVATSASRLADAAAVRALLRQRARTSTTPARASCSVRSASPRRCCATTSRYADRVRRARALGQGQDHPPSRGRSSVDLARRCEERCRSAWRRACM